MRQALERNGGLLEGEEESRDLVLGAPALLGIFLAVGMVCALCFGFGYSQGHGWRGLRSLPVAQKTAPPEPKPLAAAPLPKPAPGVSIAEPDSGGAVTPTPRADGSPQAAIAAREPALETTSASAEWMVQIAAVSRAADAETLTRALRRGGFGAIVRTSSADEFFHVQVGPFATMGAAKAMRARLAGSGYNAFVKP